MRKFKTGAICKNFVIAVTAMAMVQSAPTIAWAESDELEKLEKVLQNDLAERAYDQAVEHCLPLARKGNHEAQFSLCMIYVLMALELRKKEGGADKIKENEKSAKCWLWESAKNGNDRAIMLKDEVREHGNKALYVISIEHLVSPP